MPFIMRSNLTRPFRVTEKTRSDLRKESMLDSNESILLFKLARFSSAFAQLTGDALP